MDTIPQYTPWQRTFGDGLAPDRAVFTDPAGEQHVRAVFAHRPATFVYDVHGYESVNLGEAVPAVRYTPAAPGEHRWRALSGERIVAEGTLRCVASDHPGYVRVSTRDPRYFAFSNGDSYCPVGLDLCWPTAYALPRGGEFEVGQKHGTLGMGDYRRWFAKMARQGATFARIWLSNAYFAANSESFDALDDRAFARCDALVALARAQGIRLKLCFENFRAFDPLVPQHTTLAGADGTRPADMAAWYTDARWQVAWWRKVEAYVARHGDDPTVMAWELWNEINACRCDWPVLRDWTARTLDRLRPLVPRQLVVNSLGSLDSERSQRPYDDFKMDAMDFQQVHCYLDQGASLPLVREDPVAFSIDTLRRARRPDRPVLLAETGAVNNHHTGPFRYYRHDDDGALFADTTYPALFAGAAGSGHIWHWDVYVDQKNLWDGFAPLARLIEGVALDREGFVPVDVSTPACWCLALRGRTTHLLWVRNKAARWDHTLRDGHAAAPVTGLALGMDALPAKAVDLCLGWREEAGAATLEGATLLLPTFTRLLFVRLRTSLSENDAPPSAVAIATPCLSVVAGDGP